MEVVAEVAHVDVEQPVAVEIEDGGGTRHEALAASPAPADTSSKRALPRLRYRRCPSFTYVISTSGRPSLSKSAKSGFRGSPVVPSRRVAPPSEARFVTSVKWPSPSFR